MSTVALLAPVPMVHLEDGQGQSVGRSTSVPLLWWMDSVRRGLKLIILELANNLDPLSALNSAIRWFLQCPRMRIGSRHCVILSNGVPKRIHSGTPA